MKFKYKFTFSLLFFSLLFFTLGPADSSADHSWNGYHWARTSNPFSLKLGDNLSTSWKPFLVTVSSDWNASSVLDTTIVSGNTSSRRCKPTLGRVEVCNYRYGENGWLGYAQIWVKGGHITQGVVKNNDTYLTNAFYNTSEWKNFVLCQEVGHTLGLDHQDEIFENPNLGNCMDYTNNPISNQHPNSHDFEELETIYGHLDLTSTLGTTSLRSSGQELDRPSKWGHPIKKHGQTTVYSRNFGRGNKVITAVISII